MCAARCGHGLRLTALPCMTHPCTRRRYSSVARFIDGKQGYLSGMVRQALTAAMQGENAFDIGVDHPLRIFPALLPPHTSSVGWSTDSVLGARAYRMRICAFSIPTWCARFGASGLVKEYLIVVAQLETQFKKVSHRVRHRVSHRVRHRVSHRVIL